MSMEGELLLLIGTCVLTHGSIMKFDTRVSITMMGMPEDGFVDFLYIGV